MIEFRPLGYRCNLACVYCYQNHSRKMERCQAGLGMEELRSLLDRDWRPFVIFGGEPLLLPERELEAFLRLGFEKHNGNTLQTNGTLINEQHIELFKKYQVRVGVSIDGPEKLNDLRRAGTLRQTRNATRRTAANIERLCKANIPTCLIITLHRKNASPGVLPLLRQWLQAMPELGVHHVRLHLLESDHPGDRKKYGLTVAENIQALLHLAQTEISRDKQFIDIFHDIRRLLMGDDREVSCVWRGCDPYHTLAVKDIGPSGVAMNCGRIQKGDNGLLRSDKIRYERYLTLYRTPREYGGCRGCRFFLFCKGYCPGMALDNDWKNRSEYCEVWQALFKFYEGELLSEGKQPLSISAYREPIEAKMIAAWATGQNPSLAELIAQYSPQFIDTQGILSSGSNGVIT